MKVLRIGFANAFAAKMRSPSVTTDTQQQWFALVSPNSYQSGAVLTTARMQQVKEALCSKNVVEVVKKVEAPKVHLTLQRNA